MLTPNRKKLIQSSLSGLIFNQIERELVSFWKSDQQQNINHVNTSNSNRFSLVGIHFSHLPALRGNTGKKKKHMAGWYNFFVGEEEKIDCWKAQNNK